LSVLNVVKHNFFRDSIQLMRLTEDAKKLSGVLDANVSMGTETNKLLLGQLGLLMVEGKAASDGDMIIAISVGTGTDAQATLAKVQEMVLSPPKSEEQGVEVETYHSVDTALRGLPGANIAIVSLPGNQAFDPSMALLRKGVNVHLFSDHVSLEEEAKLKEYASANGLLLLGPGAGTSLVGGVGLGFANVVKKGSVGVVAAAGTGLQEVSVLLDRIGLGVSHGLGVGGSDVSKSIGGLMMRDSLSLLERDPNTKTLMIVAKTPAPAVMKNIMAFAKEHTTKPVVACFLGLDYKGGTTSRIQYAKTLHSAVSVVAKVSKGLAAKRFKSSISMKPAELIKLSEKLSKGLTKQQKFCRFLYSGGTLAHETLLIYRELIGEAYSNSPLSPRYELKDPSTSKGNCVVDLGDEYFTAGRPHPMIDPTIRKLRIVQEGNDPTVAAVLLDIVLGYGSSSDPGGSLVSAIEQARENAQRAKRGLVFMAHVCGTNADPQSLSEQSKKLAKAGVVLFPTNAQMALASALLIGGAKARKAMKRKWRSLLAEN
jgi:succinyl-CoA synthetase alpha subunit